MTARDAIASAIEAYDRLEELAAEIEDEWQYVTDLAAGYRSRLEELAEGSTDDNLPSAVALAIDESIVEISRITDPHRAIDWLSTYPQIVGFALGSPLWEDVA